MTEAFVRYDRIGPVARLVLDDPASLNALTIARGEQLLAALNKASAEARAILITGAGRAFCSGAKLNGGDLDLDDPMRDIGLGLDAPYNPIIAFMRNASQPVITAVRGAAAGIGCAIALSGDIIVAGESGYFLQAFANVGLAPDGGSSYLLTHAIGRVRAMEMMLLGERVSAEQALAWGLINRLFADEALDAEALALATRLAQGPRSLGLIKRLAWSALDSTFDSVLADERRTQRDAGRTADGAEGVRAFLEKRKPVFTGQ